MSEAKMIVQFILERILGAVLPITLQGKRLLDVFQGAMTSSALLQVLALHDRAAFRVRYFIVCTWTRSHRNDHSR